MSHVFIEVVAPSLIPNEVEAGTNESRILLLFGPQKKQIPATVKELKKWLTDEDVEASLFFIVCTLTIRRGHHDHRAAIIANNHSEAVAMTDALADGKSLAGITTGRVLGKDEEKGAVWTFSGHGV